MWTKKIRIFIRKWRKVTRQNQGINFVHMCQVFLTLLFMNLALLRSRVWAFGPDSLASRLEKLLETQRNLGGIRESKGT